MAAGTVVIWAVVMGTAFYAVLGSRRPTSAWFADRFVLVGGVVFPVVVLAALLTWGLSLLPGWSADDPPDLRIHVTAEQYWWRIAYELPDGAVVETANEIRLPAGATAEFSIASADVIHSFWIPALGGKMDAIPGRINVLRLRPDRIGTYRGVCAEFCGPSHAFMAMDVRVEEGADFAAWLARQQQAAAPDPPGAALFVASGCAACHTVRGLTDTSSIGPDLTHFASRPTVGAGTLANTRENVRAWLDAPEHAKPSVNMPPFRALAEADRETLVDFLMELR